VSLVDVLMLCFARTQLAGVRRPEDLPATLYEFVSSPTSLWCKTRSKRSTLARVQPTPTSSRLLAVASRRRMVAHGRLPFDLDPTDQIQSDRSQIPVNKVNHTASPPLCRKAPVFLVLQIDASAFHRSLRLCPFLSVLDPRLPNLSPQVQFYIATLLFIYIIRFLASVS
jgi:hypothetical protein